MQFQVPQFIETEDKIVGPFSMRQFGYLLAAGGVSVFLYFTVEFTLWAVLSVFFAGIALALGLIQVEGRPLVHVVGAALGFFWKPQTYVWQAEKQQIPKEEALYKEAGGVPLEDIISGLSLHNIWKKLQTGTTVSPQQFENKTPERYQIFQRLSGERREARRVDYR